MRQVLILNDVHLGVQRSAGTTPTTAVALKAYLLHELESLMFEHTDKDIIFNGDVFDKFDVPLADAFAFFDICQRWLEASVTGSLILSLGNHDLAKDSSKLCSLTFVASVLPIGRVKIINESTHLESVGVYIIPHVINQDIFDNELLKAVSLKETLILVHANFDNKFAAQSDNSLNMSAGQASCMTNNNNTVLFGHEHIGRKPQKRVVIAGNQWPSSVSDCLGNSDKFAYVFNPSTKDLSPIRTWSAKPNFISCNWDELDQVTDQKFIRVCGDCATDQASEMLAVISRLRQSSDAFVITNAVNVAGVVGMDELPSNLEAAKGFDVLGFLFENLDPEQTRVVKELMGKAND